MATFFNFDQYSEGALSISSTALRVDAPIGTFSSNANPYEPGSFLNGITSFRPNYNVYILHDSGAAHGASQRNCVISFTVPNQTTFSRLSLDIQHNSGSPGLVAPISIAFEASTTVDFQNATQLGTLDSVFSGPEGLHFTLSFTDRDHASLGMATPDERNPGSQIAYLTPDCVAMFSFEAVDQLDYNQGYRIISDSKYVGPMDIFRRSDCISFVAEANRALIFLPDFSDTLTFVLRNIADGQLLTRPWDYTVDIGLQSRCAVVLAQLNSPLYGATQQIFRMPAWALREAQMANLPSDLRVIVSSSGRCLYANGDQLAWGTSPQSDSAVVSFITPELTSIHAVLELTTNMADATHICVNATANGTLSFWMCQSDYVLAPNNDTPVFTVCDDPRAVVPTWQILEPEVHVEQTMVVNDSPGAIHTLSNTTYIKAIVQRLNRTSLEKEGSLWNYSFDNALPADWLIITPEHCFDPYSTFEMRIPADGANDFNLKSCDGSSPDPTHPCVSLASSVSVPGGTPLKLHAGHSRRIYEEMYNHIISGRHFIDIASLLRKDATPSGEFLAAVRNAITRLSKTAEAMNVVIRLIFGEPLGWAGDLGLPFIPGTGPYRAAPALLLDLVRDVPSDTYSQMQIYLAYTSSAASLTWNHSKIVAVDGQRALVGGHNMWDGAYLGDNPVLDVSMKTEGLSAVDAHRFAENLWFDQVIAHGDYWAADAAAFRPGLPNRIVVGQRSVPPPRLFASFYPVDKKAFSIGSQNYYPSTPATMSEFSYIVEDTTAAQLLYDTYMSKMEAWALPSPTPLSLPDLTSYVVTITNIWCQQTSAGPGEDQIYLERAGSRIWPQNSWYETFTPLRSSVVSGVDLPAVRTIDNPQFVRLMEWDYIADDILTQVSFHPNQVLSCKTGAEELKSKKLSDLVPEVIYRTYGDMRDDRAVYTLAFKFSKVPQPNPSFERNVPLREHGEWTSDD
ncbi:hypothetical protein E4T42_05206 [Aureobasidium subglaciale]|nr:hypothetical protein E4T42_05206 [Aureobasidium subglaciale]